MTGEVSLWRILVYKIALSWRCAHLFVKICSRSFFVSERERETEREREREIKTRQKKEKTQSKKEVRYIDQSIDS